MFQGGDNIYGGSVITERLYIEVEQDLTRKKGYASQLGSMEGKNWVSCEDK